MFIMGLPIVKSLGNRKASEQDLLIGLFTNEVIK